MLFQCKGSKGMRKSSLTFAHLAYFFTPLAVKFTAFFYSLVKEEISIYLITTLTVSFESAH